MSQKADLWNGTGSMQQGQTSYQSLAAALIYLYIDESISFYVQVGQKTIILDDFCWPRGWVDSWEGLQLLRKNKEKLTIWDMSMKKVTIWAVV